MGARGLLDKYNWSTSQLLSSIYPHYDWLPWKFRVCPSSYWDDVNNQIKFVNWAGKELKINEMSDWYNVKMEVEKRFFFKLKRNKGFCENWGKCTFNE